MRRCYIIVRQVFYLSGSTHYQCAQDNPVVEVFTTAEAAIDWAYSCIHHHITHSNESLHMVEETPDSQLIYKVGSFDSLGRCERAYCVIKKGMMV